MYSISGHVIHNSLRCEVVGKVAADYRMTISLFDEAGVGIELAHIWNRLPTRSTVTREVKSLIAAHWETSINQINFTELQIESA